MAYSSLTKLLILNRKYRSVRVDFYTLKANSFIDLYHTKEENIYVL
jgi:hypothetical protein